MLARDKNHDLRPISGFISEVMQDRAIVVAIVDSVIWKANRKPHPSFRMEGGSNRLEIIPNEGISLEDYHVV